MSSRAIAGGEGLKVEQTEGNVYERECVSVVRLLAAQRSRQRKEDHQR